MKYSAKTYALALFTAVSESDKDNKRVKSIAKNFLHLILRNGDVKIINNILDEVSKMFLKSRGLKKVILESAGKIESKWMAEIKKTVGKSMIEEKTNPDLLAGVKILINDEILIDASAKRRLWLLKS